MKHQLSALGVLRPKIAAVRREFVEGVQSTESASAVSAVSEADEGVVGGVEEGVVGEVETVTDVTAVEVELAVQMKE